MKIPMSIRQRFTGYTDGFVLGSFRIIFGLVMIYEMLMYFRIDLIKNAFVLPRILLPYEGFGFLAPLPEPIMNVLLGLMLVSAICITVGKLFRPACLFLGTFHLYFFLLDKSLFNNHIYLFIILAFLLSLTHADEFLSLKSKFTKAKKVKSKEHSSAKKISGSGKLIPKWEIFILQLQFAIVYFYGGLAKINSEWLVEMQPMKKLMETFPADHWMAAMMKNDFMAVFLTYGGLVFDLVIPFLLWNKSTRKWALIPIILFHLPNSQIFNDIGVFPFAMLASTILFFDTKEIPFLRRWISKKAKVKNNKKVKLEPAGWVGKLTIAIVVFQLLFPFRGLLLPNPMDWTSVANRFSWRMKIQTRALEEFNFYVKDGPDGDKIKVPINQLINTTQIKAVMHDVRAVAHVGKALAAQAREMGAKNPIVNAEIKVRWNGYPATYIVDPAVDLAKVFHSPFRKIEWAMEQPY